MKVEVLTKLREPFPAEHIGKLPRITCPACSDAKSRVCSDHQKSKCRDCGSYITERHIHLDYVGHADVTARLLDADPEWTWEPLATDEHGLPLYDAASNGSPVGLWIKLTVGGVSRIGYGSCPAGQGDAIKVLIGDALRNAAMRFGVAVDLWAKGDRQDPSAENATGSAGTAARSNGRSRPQAVPAAEDISVARAEMLQVAKNVGLGSDPKTIGQHFEQTIGKPVTAATVDEVKAYVAHLREKNGRTGDDGPVAA